jgi:hypothetical protein
MRLKLPAQTITLEVNQFLQRSLHFLKQHAPTLTREICTPQDDQKHCILNPRVQQEFRTGSVSYFAFYILNIISTPANSFVV